MVHKDTIDSEIADGYNNQKEIQAIVKKKRGRKPGSKATKLKFEIFYYDKINDKWNSMGKFASLRQASKSKEIGLSYGILSDINIGRRPIYRQFYKIEKITPDRP